MFSFNLKNHTLIAEELGLNIIYKWAINAVLNYS
jgi:hypothetical protein